MEGNRHIDRTDAVVRPIFQKEGNVYVRGKSGSGKTTLLLERLQFLAQEGVALKRTLNLVAYKEDTAHLNYLWKSEYSSEEEEDAPMFRSTYQFCYNIIHHYNAKRGIHDSRVSRDFKLQVARMIQEHFSLSLNHYALDSVYRKLGECKGMMMSESSIAQIEVDGIDFPYLYSRFEQYKEQRGLVSYEDLMAQAAQCLMKDEELLDQYRSYYSHIHVDDAQNLSFAAHVMLKLLCGEGTSLTLFIDPDQYAGQHAPYLLSFEDFSSSYPDAALVELNRNFRCDVNIDEMIQKFMHSDHAFHLEDDSVVRFITAKDLNESYHHALVLARNNPQMVFLSREHFTLLPLADLLEQEGLPFTVSDFHSFFRDETIHDLIELFRLMLNPRDLEAFSAIQKKVGFGFSERNINEIGALMGADPSLDIYSAIVNSNIRSSVKNRVVAHIEEIRIAQHLSSTKLLLYVLSKLHYEDHMKQRGCTLKSPNLLVFSVMAQRYERPIELLARLEQLTSVGSDQIHYLQLYSFSQVKGKEFDEVCFLDCLDAFYHVFPDQENERRLFYSILSKIRSRMYFLVARTAFMQSMVPHAFINDLYRLMKKKNAEEKPVRRTVKKQPNRTNLKPGKRIVHSTLGKGRVRRIISDDDEIEIVFSDGVAKRLNLTSCLDNNMLSF